MRTDSLETAENDILATRIDVPAIDAALTGELAFGEYPDQMGDIGLWAVRPVGFLGVRWALVVKEDSDELFAPLPRLQANIATGGAVFVLLALVLSMLSSRSIATPVVAVNAAMKQVSEGDYGIDIPATGRGDEIGDMARSHALNSGAEELTRTTGRFRTGRARADVVELGPSMERAGAGSPTSAALSVAGGARPGSPESSDPGWDEF